LIGGIEKSGKSSLASTFVVKFLQDGIPCAYINSELPDDEFFQRMASNETRIPFNSIQEKDVDGWKEKYKNLLQYVGVNEISTDGQLDINKAIAHAEFMSNKSKIIVFDNATSFSFSEEKKPAWEILGKAFSRIITLTRIRKVCSFLVCHSKQDASYVETPQNMSKILKSGNYSKVFEDSNTFVRKPQMADILGGTAAKIGLGGAMLIWRPFQKISHEDAGVVSSLVFESFRHSKANGAVLIDFNGETFSFSEKFFQSPEVAFSQKKVEPKREEVNFNENF
jgi:KaiC/GvpD/RAD55 family RecA-like ATPase